MKKASAASGTSAPAASSMRGQTGFGENADRKSARYHVESERQSSEKSVTGRPRLSLGRSSIATARANETTPASSELWVRMSICFSV